MHSRLSCEESFWKGNSMLTYLKNPTTRTLIRFLVLAVFLMGCGETVQFNVLRAAKVNVKQFAGAGEPTVSVGSWKATDGSQQSAADEIGQYLREAITNAEGGVVKFAQSGGAVSLEGTLMEHSYAEKVTADKHICSTVKDKQKVDYPCTEWKRSGRAILRVSMNVVDASGKTVAAESVPLEATKETTVTIETTADPNPPGELPAIDGQGILLGFRRQAADQLARNVVPYRVNVQKPWLGCGDAKEVCKVGLAELKAGNFEAAGASFSKAVEQLKAAPKPDPEALSAAYWALTLTNEFGGDYAAAEAMLQKAIEQNPGEEAFAAETASIRTEKANAKKLVGQGVGQ